MSIRLGLIVPGLLVLVSCGKPSARDACEDYVTAANACATAAGVDAGVLDPEATCAGYDNVNGDAAEASIELMNCYTDAYSAADCSTDDGFLGVSTDLASCLGVETDTDTDTDADSDTDSDTDADLLIISVNDDVGDSSSNYEVDASGVTSGGLLDISQDTSDAWSESHDLTGSDDIHLSVSLSRVSSPSAQENNQSTLFNSGMNSLMLFKATIYTPDNDYADCVVWTGSATDTSAWGSDAEGCADANYW
jgi:hypothetical protein